MCDACSPPRRFSRRHALGLAAGGVAWTMGATRAGARGVPSLGLEVAPGLVIQSRDAWGSDLPPQGPMGDEDVRFLLVHHTATDTNHGASDVVRILRGIYAFHTGPDKGWPDVCYNFLIDRFGGVWEGRAGSLSRAVVADATGGSQGFAQLVCLIGDFTSVLPTAEAQASLVRTLAWLADRYAIDTSPGAMTSFVSRGSNRWPRGTTVTTKTIAGHRDMSATACPGDRFYPVVRDQLQSLVTSVRTSASAPAPTPPQPTAATSAEPPTTTTAPTTAAPTSAAPTTAGPTTTGAPSATAVPETTVASGASTTAMATSVTGSQDDRAIVAAGPPALGSTTPPSSPPAGRFVALPAVPRTADRGATPLVAAGGVAVAALATVGWVVSRRRANDARSAADDPGVDGRSRTP